MLETMIRLLLLLTTITCLHAQAWQLPFEIDDDNSLFNFTVNSTWVVVKGTTKGNKGKIWQDPKHPENIKAELFLPVKNFETGLLMRDNHMHDIMESEKFPNVEVRVNFVDQLCIPADLEENSECTFTQIGSLKIRDITRELTLKSAVTRTSSGYLVKGAVKFSWRDFGVSDPSTFFATLDDIITVDYQIKLKAE